MTTLPAPSLTHLMGHLPALAGVASTDGRFVRLTAAWETFFGLPLDVLEGAPFIQFVHPDDVEATIEALARLDANEAVVGFENRYRSASGQYRRMVWRSNRGPDGYVYFTVEDMTEAHQLRETLEASNERLRQVAEIAGIGGWEVDLVNEKVFWDETTRRIHEVPDDFTPTLDAGVNFYDGEAAKTIGDAVRQAVEHGDSWDVVLPLITYKGRRIFVRASGKPLAVDRRVTRLTGTFQDVTAEHRRAEALESSRAAAETANEAKSRFLANMSHEIRTPLNGVLGMAQLLQRTAMTDRQSHYLQTLQDSGAALASLLDDVLDLARIEAGEVRLIDEAFDLRDVLNATRSAVAAQAAQKDLALTVSIDPALPLRVQGDAAHLRQVLINLMGNAVKFTDEGQVSLAAEAGHGDTVRIVVTDTGVGVPDNMKHAIFERFTQVDSSETRRNAGAGLGLAISRELVNLAGGRITLRDAPGGGAAFCVEWPLPAASSQSEARNVRAAPQGGRSVLVAEDNPVNAMLLEEALQLAGHSVVLARNGLEAVDLALNVRPDVIIMDIHMPELNGIDAIERLRNSAAAAFSIVVLTADVTPETRLKAEQLEINGFFAKPVDISALLDAVNAATPRSIAV